MMGMEKMLGGMIGMSPDQMKEKAAEFEAFVRNGSEALVSIAQTQQLILAKLETLENVNGK